MAMLPINPLRTESGALAALVDKFGEENVKPIPLDKSEPSKVFRSFNVIQDDISIEIASELQIGSIFGGTANVNSRAFYFDAIAFTDKYDRSELEGKVIFGTRWGIGIRIVLNISKIETDFQFDLSNVSAAVQLGKARARYEILGIGLGIDGLSIVLDNLSPLDDFSYDSYDTIRKKVIPGLSKYIKKNKDNLLPEPIGVELIEPITVDLLSSGKSVAYAVTQISKGKSLEDTIKAGESQFEVKIIHDVYGSLVGNIPKGDEPSESAVTRAKNWLKEIKIR